jgi:hypothetical protein
MAGNGSSFTGKDGYVDFLSIDKNYCTQSYSITVNITIESFPCMNSLGDWMAGIVTSKDWTASIECSLDDVTGMDLSSMDGSSVYCVFFTSIGSFSGDGIVSGSASVNETRNTVTFNISGDGKLSENPS